MTSISGAVDNGLSPEDFLRGENPPSSLLLDAMHNAKQRSFLEFYDKFAPKVFAYARARSYQAEAAEDIVQKVFEIAWRRFDEVAGKPSPDLWILRITENTCRYERRKFWRRQEVLVSSNTDIDKLTVSDPAKARFLESPLERKIIEDELYGTLQKFVSQLPKKQREVFEMRMSSITYEEIGYALHISAEAARRRMLRAMDAGKHLFGEFLELLD